MTSSAAMWLLVFTFMAQRAQSARKRTWKDRSALAALLNDTMSAEGAAKMDHSSLEASINATMSVEGAAKMDHSSLEASVNHTMMSAADSHEALCPHLNEKVFEYSYTGYLPSARMAAGIDSGRRDAWEEEEAWKPVHMKVLCLEPDEDDYQTFTRHTRFQVVIYEWNRSNRLGYPGEPNSRWLFIEPNGFQLSSWKAGSAAFEFTPPKFTPSGDRNTLAHGLFVSGSFTVPLGKPNPGLLEDRGNIDSKGLLGEAKYKEEPEWILQGFVHLNQNPKFGYSPLPLHSIVLKTNDNAERVFTLSSKEGLKRRQLGSL